ncbi:MAG: DUF4230 domain-containing protein [Spirosomataceae bacterium]
MFIKKLVQLLVIVLLIAGVIFIWEKLRDVKNPFTSDHTPEVTSNILLEKITAMGKLELVKYNFKDVVESKIQKDLLPDAKVLLVVMGEATGCIDLTKIRVADIENGVDKLVVHLPEPEICTFKIDHAKSKVYDSQFAFMDEAELVDQAFKKAEVQVQKSAQEMGIIQETKASAQQILKPFLEQISGKQVVLMYGMQDTPRRLK